MWKLQFQSDSFSINNGCALQLSTLYRITNHKNFISKYLENALKDFAQTSRTLKQFMKEKLRLTLLEEKFPVPWNTGAGKIGYGVISLLWQLRCHSNPVIITNLRLYLIQLWWQSVQIFVNGDVVYAQNWELLTLKKPHRATLRSPNLIPRISKRNYLQGREGSCRQHHHKFQPHKMNNSSTWSPMLFRHCIQYM